MRYDTRYERDKEGYMFDKLIFELSSLGRKGVSVPEEKLCEKSYDIPDELKRKEEIGLPQVTESDVIRHFTHLSKKNFSVDTGFYPLGSCSMKYNPKINEEIARRNEFADLHPYSPVNDQGALRLMYELQGYLSEITGMDKFTLQ